MNTSVNELVGTPESLVLQEKHYRLLIESVEDYVITLLDPSGKVVTWNNGGQKIQTYKPEEIIGRHFSVFYSPDAIDREVPDQELKTALQEGRLEEEGWRVRQDGSVFWANVVISPIYEHGRHIGFAMITRDLTERKKAEDDLFLAYRNLEESEERYRLMIEGVGDYAIFMLDPTGKVATWNGGAKRLKGYEAEEIIGKHFSWFYSQADRDRKYPDYELAEAIRLGRFEDLGWRIRKDGSVFWANVVITALRNKNGDLVGFSKITRDLTERKQLEEQLHRANAELKEGEERVRLLIDSVKDYAILMLNPAGEIISWNIGAERIKGYKAQEVQGKHFSIFYSREAVAQGFPQYELNQALKQGRFEDEGWRIRKDGSAFWANVVITTIYNANGQHIGFSKVTRDITDKRRNEELMRKNQELVRLNRDLDNFVYTASHDLKTPSSNLEGLFAELKQQMGADQQKYADILPWIDDTLLNLKKVVADLTEVIRVDQQGQVSENVKLAELLAEIKDNLRDQIQAKKVKMTEDFSQVPAIAYPRKNLRSILFNLVSNAIKYSGAGKIPEISVTTRWIPNENAVLLTVSDNGLGIPQNQQDKIFTLFRRVHTQEEGSGVGLYLVKKILENQGDRIELESQESKGSTFKVYFYQR